MEGIKEKNITGKNTVELNIEGMDCPSCAMKIEKTLNKLEGVNAKVDLGSETAAIDITNPKFDLSFIKSQIDKLGYKVIEDDPENDEAAEQEKKKALRLYRWKITTSIVLSIIIVLLGMKDHISFLAAIPMGLANLISLPLSTIVVFWCGWKFIKGFAAEVKAVSPGMDTLVVMGVLSAYFYSVLIMIFPSISGEHEHMVYFESAAMIITFILLGNYLEFTLKNRTQYAIRSLLSLQSKNAILMENGIETEVPIKKVKPGDVVLVKPGERIPVDGLIIEGSSSVDESMITGESMPADKVTGSKAIGGTLNINGYLKITTQKTVSESFLSKIITLVKDAQKTKPKIQRIADKVSSVFVPIVIVIAIVTFVVWNFAIGQTLSYSLLKAVAVLIIACPCALGLATPIAIVLGVGKAAENKILFNNAEAIENVNKIDTVIFDKTGTLTYAEFEVTEVIPYSNGVHYTADDILKKAASIENYSEHPIAKAIVSHYRSSNGSNGLLKVDSFKNTSGIGVEASIAGINYKLGGANLVNKESLNVSSNDGALKNIYLFESNTMIGEIRLSDRVKHNAKEVITRLKQQGYSLALISGDNREATEKIAKELGIDDFRYEVMPDKKQSIVSELQAKGKKTAMIGDGINDAPALSKADLGIAIGTGEDIAIQSADVILVNGELENIPALFKISNKTIRIIKQNIFWAFFYNAAAIPLAAGVLVPIGISISPVIASMLMAFSDVITVLINSSRIKYMKI